MPCVAQGDGYADLVCTGPVQRVARGWLDVYSVIYLGDGDGFMDREAWVEVRLDNDLEAYAPHTVAIGDFNVPPPPSALHPGSDSRISSRATMRTLVNRPA